MTTFNELRSVVACGLLLAGMTARADDRRLVRSVDNPVVVDARGERLGGVVGLNGPVATVVLQVAGRMVSVQAMKNQLLPTGSPLYFTTNNCSGVPLVVASAPGVVEPSTLASPGTSIWVAVPNVNPVQVTALSFSPAVLPGGPPTACIPTVPPVLPPGVPPPTPPQVFVVPAIRLVDLNTVFRAPYSVRPSLF